MNQTILEAFSLTLEKNRKHFISLFNRKTGSQFNHEWREPTDFAGRDIARLPWQELPKEEFIDGIHLPFCQYFRLDEEAMKHHFPFARQKMETSNSIDRDKIRASEAVHTDEERGTRIHELVSDHVGERPCTEAWLIIGPASDEDNNNIDGLMVWTMFPGELTPPLPKDWDGKLESLDLSKGYAVKAA